MSQLSEEESCEVEQLISESEQIPQEPPTPISQDSYNYNQFAPRSPSDYSEPRQQFMKKRTYSQNAVRNHLLEAQSPVGKIEQAQKVINFLARYQRDLQKRSRSKSAQRMASNYKLEQNQPQSRKASPFEIRQIVDRLANKGSKQTFISQIPSKYKSQMST